MKENAANSALAVREIMFDGDPISVLERDGAYFVPMKPICDVLGVNWDNQRQVIKADPVLSSVTVVTTATGADGKQYDMVCLPLSYLNGWLFKIDANRYEGERQEKIIRYQKECYDVLFKHFFKQFRTVTEEMKAKLAYMKAENILAAEIQRTSAIVYRGFKQIMAGKERLADYDATPGIQERIKNRIDERMAGIMADRITHDPDINAFFTAVMEHANEWDCIDVREKKNRVYLMMPQVLEALRKAGFEVEPETKERLKRHVSFIENSKAHRFKGKLKSGWVFDLSKMETIGEA